MCSTEIIICPATGVWAHMDDIADKRIPPDEEFIVIDVGVASDTQIQDFVQRYICS